MTTNYFYETVYGNILFDFKYSNAIVRLSGGFDSAVMLYALVKAASEKGIKNFKVYPITVRRVGNRKRNHPDFDKPDPEPIVKDIINFVREEFPDIVIKDSLIGDTENWWKDRVYVNAQKKLIIKIMDYLKNNNEINNFWIYNGVTKNPDTILDKNDPHPEPHRSVFDLDNAYPNSISVMIEKDNTIDPYRNFDKRAVFSLADKLGIKEKLLEITRSCEGFRWDTENFITTCNVCWWCLEREWAKENYDKS